MTDKPNRLAQESSPYLQQHANNPVDWYPWSEEALLTAKRENKPILLSIGYAACHWCHVMAHESFEDLETARLMNKLFINIKVDREERPDLDKIYQTAHYVLTQHSGGWPLTIFLTPDDLTPFFSGTYFPVTSRYQLPAFKDVLLGISDIYHNRQVDIKAQNEGLLKILQHHMPTPTGIQLNAKPLEDGQNELKNRYDPMHGGFNGAPKFPQAPKLEFLLALGSDIAIETLTRMAEGGIQDQLGGGFFRYSVDAGWRIPHFEKMLYDNAQLLPLYALASQQTKTTHFREVALHLADWVIMTMQSPDGGYFSSLDADSEGHEGKYYVWDAKEVESLLNAQEMPVITLRFGLDKAANFEGSWHLYVERSLPEVAELLKMSIEETQNLLNEATLKLLSARNLRITPHRDEKILTSWNSLLIKGMLITGHVLKEPPLIQSAEKALAFIQQKLWRDHRLLVSAKDGLAHLPAYVDDYAFLIDALITSLQLNWDKDRLLFAIELANTLLSRFYDKSAGGFYFTADDHEKLLYRPKTMMDEAIPSGNAIAVRVLLTLGHLLGDQTYLEAAEKTLQAAWQMLSKHPSEHCGLLLGLKDYLQPPQTVVIRGTGPELQQWRDHYEAQGRYVFAIPNEETTLPGLLALKEPRDKTCAYLCEGLHCLEVIE